MSDKGVAYQPPFGFSSTTNNKQFNSLDYKTPNDNKLTLREGDGVNGYVLLGDDLNISYNSIIRIGDLDTLCSETVLNESKKANMFIGSSLLTDATNVESSNIVIGHDIARSNKNLGSDSILIGNDIIKNGSSSTISDRAILIGNNIKDLGNSSDDFQEAIIIGNDVGHNATQNNIIIGEDIMKRSANAPSGVNNVVIGSDLLQNNTSSNSCGSDNIIIGNQNSASGCSGDRNIRLGRTMRSNFASNDSIIMGFGATDQTEAEDMDNSIILGSQAIPNNKMGENNIAIGRLNSANSAQYGINRAAKNNVAIGRDTFRFNNYSPSDGNKEDCVVIGESALQYPNGNGIIAVGTQAAVGNSTIGTEDIDSGSISIGDICNRDGAGEGSIKIGHSTASNSSGIKSISIGRGSGTNAGNFSISLGEGANNSSSANLDNVIVLIAEDTNRDATGSNRTFISPIRAKNSVDSSWYKCYYNPNNGEIVYYDP